MDINVNLTVKFEETPALINCFSTFCSVLQSTVETLAMASTAAATTNPAPAAAEEATPVKRAKKSAKLAPAVEAVEKVSVAPEKEEPKQVRTVTVEDARAKATALLKEDPKNRDKVADALKECGAAKLTEITEPAGLLKFVELLEA